MTSLETRRNAARRAASHLMRTGLDCGVDLRSAEAIDWLADVALHVSSLDPIEIGAGAILDSSGYVRVNVQLTMDMAPAAVETGPSSLTTAT
jgi:hypothetical protein